MGAQKEESNTEEEGYSKCWLEKGLGYLGMTVSGLREREVLKMIRKSSQTLQGITGQVEGLGFYPKCNKNLLTRV